MDLSWSADGLTLYAVSSDGTLACLAFDAAELEGRASKEAQKQYLSKFGFVPPPLPSGYAHALESAARPAAWSMAPTKPERPHPLQQNHSKMASDMDPVRPASMLRPWSPAVHRVIETEGAFN